MRWSYWLVVLPACGFPSPELTAAAEDAGVVDSSVVEASPDTAEAASDTHAPDDVADTTGEAAIDASDPCDKDRDGFKAKGGSCGGVDCDDGDGRANPGVSGFVTYDATGKAHGGDWNCDGKLDRQFDINVSCGLLGGAACSSTKGFSGNPTCGTSGKYVQCATSGALCVEASSRTEIQGCR